MRQPNKKRFSVGRRVLVGMGSRPGTVQSVDEVPSALGEFAHEVLLDGETQPLDVLGCDMHAVPPLDEDLQRMHRPTVHIQDSHVANLNLGSQVGNITAILESISGDSAANWAIASALDELTKAVVSSTSLPDVDKQEVMQALSTIAEQAAKKPEDRARGILKAAVAWIPTAISTAADLTTLWDKYGPIIKSYFGF